MAEEAGLPFFPLRVSLRVSLRVVFVMCLFVVFVCLSR